MFKDYKLIMVRVSIFFSVIEKKRGSPYTVNEKKLTQEMSHEGIDFILRYKNSFETA